MSGFSFISKIRNKIKIYKNNHVVLGKKTRIRYCNIYIAGNNNQLVIKDKANLRNVSIELVGDNCTLVIGEDCVIGENCYLSCREKGTELVVGKGTMFSRNVKIMTSDGHNITSDGQRINFAKNIHIGSNVWLADNTTILKGVSVGDYSIVGINSTLTTSIPCNAIAAGNPARVIKSGVQWEKKLTY